MATYKLSAVQKAMQGCVENDYKSIVRAAFFLREFLCGNSVDCWKSNTTEPLIKESLYRKFMRAYTRYILDNPGIIKEISEDCAFASMINGEYTGIDEITESLTL